jgi:hypothetical protein
VSRFGGHVIMSSLTGEMEDRVTRALAQFATPTAV